jgi:hypothetical protein
MTYHSYYGEKMEKTGYFRSNYPELVASTSQIVLASLKNASNCPKKTTFVKPSKFLITYIVFTNHKPIPPPPSSPSDYFLSIVKDRFVIVLKIKEKYIRARNMAIQPSYAPVMEARQFGGKSAINSKVYLSQLLV